MLAILKSLVATALFPVPFSLFLIGIGLALLWFTRRQTAGKIFVTAGFAVFVVLGVGVLRPALRSLERVHPPINEAEIAQVKWVVVLGGGSFSETSLPISARATGPTITRLIEGIRLHRQVPGSRLLLSGASVFGSGSDAQIMFALATGLGVPAANIVLDDESPDTETQAVNVKRIVKDEPMILVTSALHMPRAMALFEKAGLAPKPSSSQYIIQGNVGFNPASLIPNINGINVAHLVENEYLGIAWSRLRGRI